MTQQVFSGQREGEKFRFLFRRHFITTKKGFAFLLVFVALGVSLMFIWPTDDWIKLVSLFLVSIGLAIVINYICMWYFTVFIITDERLRQVAQQSFFKKTVIDLDLLKIHSISYNIPGVFAGIFGYGTIIVQTTVGDLVISYVRKPEQVYNRLQNVVNLASKKASKNV